MKDHETQMFTRFQVEIAHHEMTVVYDDGVNRNIRFARPGTYACSFNIVTWDGYLCYTGDMGSYVFSRLPDMFEFFRGRTDGRIDFGYWAEKVVAADKSDGIKRFSTDRFNALATERFKEFAEAQFLTKDEREELWDEVDRWVLNSDEHDAIHATETFRWTDKMGRQHRVFDDFFYDHACKEYTGRFLWCCFALRWAIATYDKSKLAEAR